MGKSNKRESWGSKLGVIMAVAGSAVGLGNFLRFPGQAAQNGGGAFMIPYFVSLLLIGIPLAWAEWTMARYGGQKGFHSAPGVFQSLWKNKISKYLGSLAILIPLIIFMYYVVIEAWCLSYALDYLSGSLMKGNDAQAYSDFFANQVGIAADGALFQASGLKVILVLIFTFVFNFFLIAKGLMGGIERFVKVAIPIMTVCAICVLIRVLTLKTPDPSLPEQSVIGGLGFMWNPNFSKLTDPQTWLAAASQIFFSLSVGFGVIINYASYLRDKDDVVLSGLTACSMNEFFEVCLGGLITLPAAFIFMGAGLASVSGSTFGLGFNALPNVFAQMPAGQFFGFLWFFMLFLAAVTSSLSMIQPVFAFVKEIGIEHKKAIKSVALISAIGAGFVVYFSKDLKALDTMDFWVGTFLIFVLAMLQSIIFAWIFGVDKGFEEAHKGANINIPGFVKPILKYVTPIYLLVIFIGFSINNAPAYFKSLFSDSVAGVSVTFIMVILAGILFLIHKHRKLWEQV